MAFDHKQQAVEKNKKEEEQVIPTFAYCFLHSLFFFRGRADQWAWPVEWVADQSHGPHLENAFNWTAARMVVLVARESRGAPLNAAVQPRCCCCCWP